MTIQNIQQDLSHLQPHPVYAGWFRTPYGPDASFINRHGHMIDHLGNHIPHRHVLGTKTVSLNGHELPLNTVAVTTFFPGFVAGVSKIDFVNGHTMDIYPDNLIIH